MTPREFLKLYRYDHRALCGDYVPAAPLTAEPGDRIGVVLLHTGGPPTLADVPDFVYNRYMDPLASDWRLPRALRPLYARSQAWIQSTALARCYEKIGGCSPLHRLVSEQASALEQALLTGTPSPAQVTYKTYVAMRHAHPFLPEVAQQMQADEITKVVLLPLFPQYAQRTTGSLFASWWMQQTHGRMPTWPVTAVREYAVHPKYVQALSERIDEALQRFSDRARRGVHLVFAAQHLPAPGYGTLQGHHDPYCCLVQATVEAVMQHRGQDRPHHVTFQPSRGATDVARLSLKQTMGTLGRQARTSVLVVPLSHVTDHLETAYQLDVVMREEAYTQGLEHYEVTAGLNCHPMFIEALAEITRRQAIHGLPVFSGDGLDASGTLPEVALPGVSASGQPTTSRCVQCDHTMMPRQWAPMRQSAPSTTGV
ncbi:MAG: ferrochelatase [Bacteroidota bacterium]